MKKQTIKKLYRVIQEARSMHWASYQNMVHVPPDFAPSISSNMLSWFEGLRKHRRGPKARRSYSYNYFRGLALAGPAGRLP